MNLGTVLWYRTMNNNYMSILVIKSNNMAVCDWHFGIISDISGNQNIYIYSYTYMFE